MAVAWTGTFTITTPGTAPTATNSTTLTNTGASWPTGGGVTLANMWLRVLTGPGAGTDTLIASNTATVITVSAWAGTQPTTGSTYEIVHKLLNGDTITGSLSLGNGTISEFADNATVEVTGAFSVTLTGSCIVRWGKTETTYGTIQSSTRTSARAMGSWTGMTVNTGGAISLKYMKIFDANIPLTVAAGVSSGTGSIIGKIWIEGAISYGFISSGTTDQNKTWSGIYMAASKSTGTNFSTANTAFTEIMDRHWIATNNFTGINLGASNGPTRQIVRDSINFCQQNQLFDNVGGTSKYYTIQDCYTYGTAVNDGAIMIGNSSGTGTSNYEMRRNVVDGSRSIFGAGTGGVGIMASAFNDWVTKKWAGFQAIAIANSTSYSASTSDNDFMAGTNGANKDNIDTSASTTSTATPHQYAVLTASRTNAKSVRNRPLTCNNVVVGTPTDKSVVVTFDCTNGVVAGQGSSTVTTDSNSGQTVLSTTTTTGFEVGEAVEVGYGTARYELCRIASISAGVSLTMAANLTFSHTSAQADTIKKQLRHFGLPFIRYGTATGSYNMETQVPQDEESWGLIFTGWKTTYNGLAIAWNRLGHSVTLNNLYPSTTYYIQACCYNPLGEVMVASETSFTTAADTLYSDPGVANVRLATSYSFNGASNRTGTARIPAIANVKIGYAYDSSDSLTGTYDGSDRYTDPLEVNVKLGTTYTFNTVLKTGLYLLAVIIGGIIGLPLDKFGKLGGS